MLKLDRLDNKLFFILFFFILVLGVLVEWQMFPNDNVIWFMQEARVLFHGAPYGSTMDINSPLTLFFYLPAVLFRGQLTLQHALTLYVFLLIILSVYLCRFILLRYFKDIPRCFVNLFSLLILATLILYPQYNFGEREHVVIILVLPYLFLASSRVSEIRPPSFFLSLLVGFLAGVGLIMKPYFLLVPLCVELYLAAKKRSFLAMFRAESVMIACYVLFYFFVLLLFYPDYFFIAVPFTLNLYKDLTAKKTPFYSFLLNPYVSVFYGSSILFVLTKLTIKSQIATKELENVSFVASIAFFLIFMIQRLGFLFYRVIACEIMSVILLFLLLSRVFSYMKSLDTEKQKRRLRRLYPWALVLFISVILFLSAGFAYLGIEYFVRVNRSLQWQELVNITNSLLLKNNNKTLWQTIPAGSPLNNFINTLPGETEGVNATRHYTLWPIFAIMLAELRGEHLSEGVKAAKIWYQNTLLLDLNKNKPYILLSSKPSQQLLIAIDKRFVPFFAHYKLYKRLSYVDIEVRKS